MPSWLERLRDALAPGIAVEREIASGGMGHVALGRDTLLDRAIAIKVLRPEKASGTAAERFLREARHAAALRHPNVVQVHHAKEAAGLFYYTMDYVAGETLAEALARGPMTRPEVVRLGRELLAALSAAHARGLIHRDVKPSNIFLTRDRVLLGDFGIAFALDSSRTALTRSGDLVGTPAYISPEQLHDGPITPRTDIYAAGLVLYEAATGSRWMPQSDPEKGDWSRVPGPLRGPIRRALKVDPGDRWATAAAFSEALSTERPRRAGTWRIAGAALAAALAGWLVVGGFRAPRGRDLVIVPFGTAALADTSVGLRLSGLTGWSFERLTNLRLAPRRLAVRLWRASSLPSARRLEEVIRATHSRHGASAVIRPRGSLLEVQLRVVRDDGEPLLEGTVLGDSTDLPALGDSIAQTITRALFFEPRFRTSNPFARIPLAAQTEFLLGEDAFARDAWLTAERHYLRALAVDSTFVLAAWRLGNARRWMPLRTAPPYPPGLRRLFELHRDELPAIDRYLIEAQFRPSGSTRFERYEKAVAAARDNPYAALLYGDELFHRGPLAGRPLQDAIEMLERAVAMDSTLAPAWEHLAWAHIRLGERDRAARALAGLERWAGKPEESEIYLPIFLRIAYQLRFGAGDDDDASVERLLGDPGGLALAARGAMSFDLPAQQAELGAALVASGETPDLRASGLTARGVALFALGRPRAALAAFDSAATQFSRGGEARLQAAEWRVIPAAIGVPGVEDGERERGRATLTGMLADPVLGPRAAWALALDAHARGDTAAARAWAAHAGPRFAPLLDGLRHAARERWEDALAASAPALAADSAGHAPDPFLRATLHVLRGDWLVRVGRSAEADRSWLWYENLDVRGWPDAEAQPAEVDWALATHLRVRRARLAINAGRAASGCVHARRAREIWADVEPTLQPAVRELAALSSRCSG